MVKVINPTGETVKCCTRLNNRWFDGITPGETVEVGEEKKVAAFLKHGCRIVVEAEVKKVEKPKFRAVKKVKKKPEKVEVKE